jgi:hypothetical protein
MRTVLSCCTARSFAQAALPMAYMAPAAVPAHNDDRSESHGSARSPRSAEFGVHASLWTNLPAAPRSLLRWTVPPARVMAAANS